MLTVDVIVVLLSFNLSNFLLEKKAPRFEVKSLLTTWLKFTLNVSCYSFIAKIDEHFGSVIY